ncbi:MAG: hypothetical protein J6C06_02670 [Lachnospiraceae bacterium]|nr:hypothetical protein [Lachnospiraceae bacterium]
MGRGSYTSSDWAKLKNSSKITATSTADQIFKTKKMEERFNPKFINVREARDSEDHPNSTPIMIGLDVTGSMGYLSAEIAKNGLNETMMKIYSTNPVQDPQMLFAAIGDVSDSAPLQVTQFESDIRIAEQLLSLWLEGAGGDFPEDYQLLWYFAAKHVHTDAFEKRGKKGFLFTIGDADCHEKLFGQDIYRIFDDVNKDVSSAELAKMASERFELFHIHIHGRAETLPKEFNKIIPGRILCIPKSAISALPEIIITVMQLVNGKEEEKVISQWSEMSQPIVRNAIKHLVIKNKKKGLFF